MSTSLFAIYLFYILNISLHLIKYTIILLTATLLGYKVYNDLTKTKCKSKVRLDGKVVLITGGNSGIGLETARDLARRGARVIIASRDVKRSSAAVDDIIATTGNTQVEHRYLDLSSFGNVRKFAEEFNASFNRLDILINNAGVSGLNHKLTEDGIDIVTQVNYMSPFLLTNLLLDEIIASKPSRIIMVTSVMHHCGRLDLKDLRNRTPKPWYTLYGRSKLCNVMWAKALARKVPDGVTVNSLHPGAVSTEIFEKSGPVLGHILPRLFKPVFLTPVEGAQTTIYVAVAEELKNVSGKYFSDCKIATECGKAKDEDVIERVWQETLLITNSKLIG